MKKVTPGKRRAPPSDDKAGQEVRPAEPLQQRHGQRPGQGLDHPGARPGGDQGCRAAQYGQQRGELVGHGGPDQADTGLQQDIHHLR